MNPTLIALQNLAADPQSSPERLAELAQQHPELREIIVNNPASYPGLLQWIADVTAADLAATDLAAPDPTSTDPAPEPAAPETKTVPPERKARWWIAVAAASVLALMLASGAGGVFAGWAVANRLVVAEVSRTSPEVITVALPEYQPGDVAIMPDVRGLDTERAMQAIVDAGVPAELIEVATRPAAGVVGVIVQQTPVFGAENPTSVTILESTPAIVPDFAGRPAAEIIDELQGMGARVEQTRQYVPGAVIGTVTSIVPAPGSALPESVAIVIADSASRVSLDDIDPTKGSTSFGSTQSVGGQDYDDAVTVSAGPDTETVTWTLGGHVAEVTGSLGLEDDQYSDESITVVVLADGAEIARYALAEGPPVAFSWLVSGVTTLSVQVTSAESDYGSYLVLITPEVLGSIDELGKL
ncbi:MULTISPECIES: PASTA domain-containing protein [unclassified Cryobacterium]|uniref:variant leucine-rich repeat-containing protein n=1 Tax=unclassified Cryobacterium TaxID=2649013 RepID=UPI00106A76CD|nr:MULTISPECIES: PASTA domain-containing protein [unclassified Cryobacterium]TFD06686.1 PASTA domain-containing protein [Cryobacterium sp. TMT1-66-1]TFD09931.1 PASTA domain-containing protein [Cryobacterium sp. TMT1-2-2]